MDANSFKPGDPDIILTRPLAVRILNHLEMWRDVVESRTGKLDQSVVDQITELTKLLEDDHPPRVTPDGEGLLYGYDAKVEQFRDINPDLLDDAIEPAGILLDLAREIIAQVDLIVDLHQKVGRPRLRMRYTQPIKYLEPKPEEPTDG